MEILLPLHVLRQIRDNFIQEIEKASRGEESTLSFLKTPLPRRSFVRYGEEFQILVIGGTNFTSQTVRKTRDGLLLLPAKTETLPVFIKKDRFLAFIQKHVKSQVRVVAINFAYPLAPYVRGGLIDGKLLRGTKRHTFGGMLTLSVGKLVEEEIGRKVHVAVANDTSCLVLSGFDLDSGDNLCGAVVGTGCNMGFIQGEAVINLESGNFAAFDRSHRAIEIDKTSKNPGGQLFEKEVSGDYLYKHYNSFLRERGLPHANVSSTEELSGIAHLHSPQSEIAKQLFKYSASLVACQIAGIYQYKKQPTLTFVMEGSLFWKGWKYKEMVGNYVEQLEVPKGAIRFVQIENSSVKGAAALVSH